MDLNSREITKYIRLWKCLMNQNQTRVSMLFKLLILLDNTWSELANGMVFVCVLWTFKERQGGFIWP